MSSEHNILSYVMAILVATSPIVALEISPPLSDLYVITGNPLWWTCSVKTGQTTPSATVTFLWRFQDADIYSDSTRVAYANGTLYFPQVLNSHFGKYTCTVSDSKVVNESSAWLRQAYISSSGVVLQPVNQSVALGGVAVMSCRADGQPMPVFSWKLNGVNVTRTARINIIDAFPGYSVLQINNITYTDSGSYTCFASHVTLSQPINSAPAVVSVYGRPIFTNVPRNQTVPIGYNVTFNCSVKSEPKATLKWLFQSFIQPDVTVELSSSQSIFIDDVTGSLILLNVNSSNSGNYSCNWYNEYGTIVSQAFLTVTGLPQSPQFVVRPNDASLSEGDDLHLSCNGTGNPPPNVLWVNPAGLIIPGNNFDPQSECKDTQACNESWTGSGSNNETNADFISRASTDASGSLTLKNVTSEDIGEYKCRLVNSEGVAESVVFVNIFYKPYFVTIPQSMTVDDGSQFSLSCVALGNPPSEISWSLPGSSSVNLTFINSGVNTNNNEIVSENGDLTVRNAGKSHNGVFICYASNKMGSSAASARILISGVPIFTVIPISQGVIEGDNVILQCEVDASSAANVYWYYTYIIDPSIQSTDILYIKESLSERKLPTENMTLLQIDQNSNIFFNGTSLKFVDVQERNAGLYVCSAINGHGSAFEPVILRVITFPKFQAQPANTKAPIGSTVMLDCFTVGIPIPTQRWVFKNRKVEMNQWKSLYINGSLSIENVQESDYGNYTCIATNQAGQRSSSAILTMSMLPYFVVPPSNTTAVFGTKAILTCRGKSSTSLEISWYNSDANGNRLNLISLVVVSDDKQNAASFSDTNTVQSSGGGRIQISPEGDLIFGCVELSDSSWYICYLRNSDGNTPSSPVFLTVDNLPEITTVEAPENLTLGESANITCQARGSPTAVISWVAPLKVEYTELSVGEITVSSVQTSLYVMSTLSIQSTQMDRDSGDWICKACNSVGCKKQKVTVSLEGPAIIRQVIGIENENNYSIFCISAGIPLPNITYSSKGIIITNFTDGHTVVSNDMWVKKDKILSEYTCQVANVHGNATLVLLAPQNVLITNVAATSNSFVVNLTYSEPILSLMPNKLIMRIATEGSTSWIDRIFNLSHDIDDYLDVEKDVVLNNDTSVSCESDAGKIVKRDVSLPEDISVSVTSNLTQFVYFLKVNLRGLVPNTAYLLQAAMSNILGSGPSSQLFSAKTLSAPPSPVTNVTVTVNNRTATVTWTKPDPLNGLPEDTTVTVELYNTASSANTIANTSINVLDIPQVTFPNLQPGDYTLKIFVSNRQTNTVSSIAIATFEVQSQPPSFQTNITEIKTLNAHSVLINWTIPVYPATIYPPITGYIIEISKADLNNSMKVQSTLNVSGPFVSSWQIENLIEHTLYSMRVASTNSAGVGPFSNPRTVTTASSVDTLGAGILPWWGILIIVVVLVVTMIGIIIAIIAIHRIKVAKRKRNAGIVDSPNEVVESNNSVEGEMQHNESSRDVEGHENPGFILY